MSEEKSFADTVLDTLCCCFRTRTAPKLNPLVPIKKAYGKVQSKMSAVPLEYRYAANFKSIDQLPPPEPVKNISLLQLEKDPMFMRIMSAPISLDDKLKRVVQLRQQKLDVLEGKDVKDIQRIDRIGIGAPPPVPVRYRKRTRAPPPPTPPND